MDQVLVGILVVFIIYTFFMQGTEHLDNIYSQPISMFTEAASAPNDYSKTVEYSAKECSDNSLNKEILDYQLSLLNQTKV